MTWQEEVCALRPQLERFLCGVLAVRWDDAEDIAATVIADILIKRDLPRQEGKSLRSWLFERARWRAFDFKRRRKHTALSIEFMEEMGEDLELEAGVSTDEQVLSEIAYDELVRALSKCESSKLFIDQANGKTYREMACALQIPIGTVRSRMHHHRRRAQEAIVRHRHEVS